MNNICFSQQLNIKPVGDILKLKWVDTMAKWDASDGLPIILNKHMFPFYSDKYVINIENGNKSYDNVFLKNQLLLFDYENTVVINRFLKKVKQFNTTSQSSFSGYHHPTFVNDSSNVIFVLGKFELVNFDIRTQHMKWKMKFKARLKTKPILIKDKILIATKKALLEIDIRDTTKQILLDSITIRSDIQIRDNHAIFWTLEYGLVSYDLKERKIAWYFDKMEIKRGNYNLLIEGDTVFFATGFVFAVNIRTGSLIWKSDVECTSMNFNIGLTKKNVLYYCDYNSFNPIISAVDKRTGKLKYQGLTSENFPPNINREDGLNDMENNEFEFVRGIYDNMIFAVYRDKIFAFELLED